MRASRSLLPVLALAALALWPRAAGAAQSCEELYRYRDTELFRKWETTLEQKRLFQEARRETRELGQQVLRDSELARSDFALFFATTMNDIKTGANLVGNMLDMVPATGAARMAAQTVFGTKLDPDMVENLVAKGQRIQGIVEDGLVYTLAVEWAGRVPVIGAPLKALWDLSEDLADRYKLSRDHAALRQTVYESVSHLLRAIDQYDDKIRRSQLAIDQIAAVKKGIEDYCSKQAKGAPDGREAKKPGGVCDLTGTWVDQATALSRQYTSYLKSDGARITGSASGPNASPGGFLGELRSDGTIDLAFNSSIPGVPAQRMSLRANVDCTRMTGTWKYPGFLGFLGPHSGPVDLVKQDPSVPAPR